MQVAKTTDNLYKDWDESIWCFNDGRYPVLKNMPAGAPDATSCAAVEVVVCPSGSSGTTVRDNFCKKRA